MPKHPKHPRRLRSPKPPRQTLDANTVANNDALDRMKLQLHPHPPAPLRVAQPPFTDKLRTMWAKGEFNSVQMQDLAMTSMQQGAHSLEQLAAMGNFGNHKSNIFRAMQTIWGIPKGACDIDWLPIPMKAGRYTPHPFLLPHKFFEAFYASNEIKVWRDVMAGPVGACRSYWQECQGTDFVRHHPKLPSSSWGSTIPLGMHADAGAFSSHDSLYTISWNSLLGRGSTIKKDFCLRYCENLI